MSTSCVEVYRRLLDGILIINMDSNRERYASVTAALADVLPPERTERLSAVAGRELPGCGEPPWFTERTGERARAWAGASGCTLSHRKAIACAKERGWKRVLILEDDVRPTAFAKHAESVEAALATLTGPYMLYLGYNRPVPHGTCVMQQSGGSLWRIDGVLGAHAYIVSAEAYDILLADLPTRDTVWEWMARYRAVDTYYREYAGICGRVPVYTLYPHLFSQTSTLSDISGTVVEEGNGAGEREPYPANLAYRMMRPLRCLKVRLNSLRTLLRARRGGFPGPRRKH